MDQLKAENFKLGEWNSFVQAAIETHSIVPILLNFLSGAVRHDEPILMECIQCLEKLSVDPSNIGVLLKLKAPLTILQSLTFSPPSQSYLVCLICLECVI